MPLEVDDPFEGVDRLGDMEDMPTILLPRRVAGTTVCVEVVEREDEDEEDDAGEHERGDRDTELDSNDDDKAVFDSSLDAIA